MSNARLTAPDTAYRSNGHLYSYSEDGTVTVTVDGHDSEILDAMNSAMPINVFGISADDLEVLA